jgi:hypothetical protein
MGRAILQGAALAAALVIFGVFTTPGFIVSRGGPVGAAAVLGVLAAYGLAARFGASRASPETVRLAGRFALAAGGVYVAEIVLEYGLLPRDNTPWGLAEFGLVFLLVAAAGATGLARAAPAHGPAGRPLDRDGGVADLVRSPAGGVLCLPRDAAAGGGAAG